MKTLAVILLPMLCAAADAPAGIDALLDAARAAPAEFAADAMIRIAALDQLEKARRIELLEQAFQRASGAQQPYKRHATFVRPDSPSGFLNRAYGQDLDAMSLRLRAIEALLPLDAQKARDLFLQTPPPKTPRLKCDDFLIYDVGRFYDTLGSIARQSFTAQEIQAGEPFRLLERFAGAITSPVQVAPVARMLAAASVKDADFRALVNSFAEALGKISGDDRSFAYSMTAGKQILALVEESKRRQLSPLPLLEAYRLYLVNNLSAARCADDDSMLGNAIVFRPRHRAGHRSGGPGRRCVLQSKPPHGAATTDSGGGIDAFPVGRGGHRPAHVRGRGMPRHRGTVPGAGLRRKRLRHTRPTRSTRRHGAGRFGTFSRPCPGGRRAPPESAPPPPSTSA